MGVRFDVDFGGAEMRMIMMVAARSGDGDHMEIARKDQFIVIRLDHGEDILESIKSNMKEERSTMLIVMGLGMISDFELGYFDQGNYIKDTPSRDCGGQVSRGLRWPSDARKGVDEQRDWIDPP
jgi:hypothetical protein